MFDKSFGQICYTSHSIWGMNIEIYGYHHHYQPKLFIMVEFCERSSSIHQNIVIDEKTITERNLISMKNQC